MPEFEDIIIVCADCGEDWLWTKQNQAFFWSKGLAKPKRCPSCSRARKDRLALYRGYEDG
jgi:hypothetical protein